MSEQEPREPRVRFYLVGDLPADDFAKLIGALGQSMLGEVRIGQGEFDFMEDMERESLKEKVSVQAARDFYMHLFQAKKPSPIATLCMNEIGAQIPEKEKTIDKKGNLIEIKRESWTKELTLIRAGKSILVYKPGSKKREFVDAFDAYLPKAD